jgi:hypothetical protein
MSYRSEFPSFIGKIDNEERELLARGFYDASWHNDVAPAFDKAINAREILRVWINEEQASDRETGPGCPRYILARYEEEGMVWVQDLAFSEDWDKMLSALDKYLARARPSVDDQIYANVIKAMQDAEEIWGPDRDDYVLLMERIIRECQTRISNATGRV